MNRLREWSDMIEATTVPETGNPVWGPWTLGKSDNGQPVLEVPNMQ